MIKFTAEDYRIAASERLSDCQALCRSSQNVVGALYYAGVAIECIFRGYIAKYTKEFDGKHNLENLYIRSLMHQYIQDSDKELISIMIKSAHKLWNNNCRYGSTKRLKRQLAHEIAKLDFEPKDMSKYLQTRCNELIEISKRIVKLGDAKWN